MSIYSKPNDVRYRRAVSFRASEYTRWLAKEIPC